MPRNGTKNLIPPSGRTPEEARKNAAKGGVRSGEVRRKKKAAREVAQMILDGRLPTKGIKGAKGLKKAIEQFEMPETDLNVRTGVITSVAVEAMNGNVKAAEYIIGLAGETAPQAIPDTNTWRGLPAELLGKAFVDIYRDIRSRDHRYYDFRGGRGSTKSTFCGLDVIDELEYNFNFCAMAIRQIKDTLKDSVYSQIVWAIDVLGLSDQYHCTKSPMEITKISTGQKVYFRGADDPMKIKSIRPPKGMHIGVVWIEEADQIQGNEALRNILQSVMRGGDDIIVLRSYNTPISSSHYINQEADLNRPDRIIHHSYYYDSPQKWIGKSFFELAEQTKIINERAYRHEYLGEPVGTGGTVFENLTKRVITDEEIKNFDRLYYGLDFGWFPDPTAFVKCYYNASERRLYIFCEFYEWKKSSQQIYDLIIGTGHDVNDEIISDRDQRTIGDLNSLGLNVIAAEKAPGSVDYSMKWLQGLTEIVIDSYRCPNAGKEFGEYEYERSKDGEVISGYPDKNNHAIDAVRYALNRVWRQKGK